MPTRQALERAKELDLDLVEVAPQAEPPVCRLMDFGKWKYEQDVRAKEARKRQSQVVVKEMKFRPKISSHDYEVKRNHVRRFLEEGSKVKITIMFRGREMAHTELGAKLLDRLAKDLLDLANIELMPKLDGRNMTMVLAPLKRPEKSEKPEKKPLKEGPDGARPIAEARAPQPAPASIPGPPAAPPRVNVEATGS
jgi:translation initiation factor IF-3